MLAFTDGVDRGPHVAHDVVLIEDDLARAPGTWVGTE